MDNYTATNKKVSKTFSGIYDILESLVYAIAIVVIIFIFIGRVSEVQGYSMYGTLNDGDFLFVTNPFFTYEPENGDIVVIQDRSLIDGKNNKYDTALVKRVVATEGQTISVNFIEGTISIDGGPYVYEEYACYISPSNHSDPTKTVSEETIKSYLSIYYDFSMSGGTYDKENAIFTITVPQDHVFVMGDNRLNSGDSRAFGVVHENYILGKAVFRLFPFNKIGGIE